MSTEPKKYIHGHSAAVLQAHSRRMAQRDAAYLIPHIKPSYAILDVGCGPGSISADFAQLVPDGKVTCLEVSDAALEAARRTFADRGIQNVEFVSADVTGRLPFDDETFDVVHAHQVIIHLPDPQVAFDEMRRVLKTDGILACKDMIMSSLSWFPPDERLLVWDVGITKTIAATGADPQMGRRLRALALEAGFMEEKAVSSASCWSFSSREDVAFWGGTCATRLEAGGELRRKVVEGGYFTSEQVDGFVVAAREWMGRQGAWFGCMNGEILCWK
jgi:SAM-dependent methyltransferase